LAPTLPCKHSASPRTKHPSTVTPGHGTPEHSTAMVCGRRPRAGIRAVVRCTSVTVALPARMTASGRVCLCGDSLGSLRASLSKLTFDLFSGVYGSPNKHKMQIPSLCECLMQFALLLANRAHCILPTNLRVDRASR